MNTKEERRRNFERALGINALGGVEPDQEFMELMEKYIQGELTLEGIRKIFVEKYKEDPADPGMKYPAGKDIINPKEFIIDEE